MKNWWLLGVVSQYTYSTEKILLWLSVLRLVALAPFELSPESCALNLGPWCPPLPLIQQWQPTPLQVLGFPRAPLMPGHIHAPGTVIVPPIPLVATRLTVSFHNIHHSAFILLSPYVLILEQFFFCFDTYIVAWCCPCKTGTNTHALSTTMGDGEMTAI